MKKSLLTLLLAGFASLPAHAAPHSHDTHDTYAAPSSSTSAPAESELVDGVVKRIDKAGGKITVAHGPLVNLNMLSPMTMVFRVRDVSWLDRMRIDDRIRFVAESIGGVLTIVRFEPAK